MRARGLTIRRAMTVLGLAVVWCALWGNFSVANLLAGTAVGLMATLGGIGTPGVGRVRLRPLVRFTALVAVDLVRSTVTVARTILATGKATDEAIVAVKVPRHTHSHLLMLVVAVTLTPGTAVVDADADAGMLYLHLLRSEQTGTASAHVQRLARLACAALPIPPERGAPDVMAP